MTIFDKSYWAPCVGKNELRIRWVEYGSDFVWKYYSWKRKPFHFFRVLGGLGNCELT